MSRRLLRLALLLSPLAIAMAIGVPVCPSALIARVSCPGCGLTRATLQLLQGDLSAATALQPLALVVCPLLSGAALYAAYRYVFVGRVNWENWHAGKILVVSMTALTFVWIARFFGFFGGPVTV